MPAGTKYVCPICNVEVPERYHQAGHRGVRRRHVLVAALIGIVATFLVTL